MSEYSTILYRVVALIEVIGGIIGMGVILLQFQTGETSHNDLVLFYGALAFYFVSVFAGCYLFLFSRIGFLLSFLVLSIQAVSVYSAPAIFHIVSGVSYYLGILKSNGSESFEFQYGFVWGSRFEMGVIPEIGYFAVYFNMFTIILMVMLMIAKRNDPRKTKWEKLVANEN